MSRERRLLTVMFCDLVGSTALAERLDPEELSDLVLAYQKAAGGAIQEFEGHVAQHLGDGLLVYFGYPVAHEDDARRAVHAGLRVIDALRSLNAGLDRALQLSVRIGVHTGPVVTGELGSGTTQERLALGSAPNVAARLQSIAGSDTVVISGQTYELLKNAFVCEPLGAGTLKGLSQPIDAYRVIEPVDVPGVAARPSTEMLGRREELALLWRAYETARGGEGASVLVTAEAGLGKSRLAHAFLEEVAASGGECWVGHCSAYEQTSALSSITGVLRQMFDLPREETPGLRFTTLVAAIERLGLPLSETVPLIAGLLSVPVQDPFAPPDVTPHKRKELTLEAAVRVIIRRTERQPVVLLLEDLHWADPSTLEFLGLLMSRATAARLLIAMTSRPVFANPWNDRIASVVLAPMAPADVKAIISRVAGGRTLPDWLVERIIEKTDGIPLFVEELTKTILESGGLTESAGGYVAADLGSVLIPTSLQASLTARLDRLGSAKEVAQLGSVIGRDFSFEMLQAVAPWGEEVLLRDLDRLTRAELVYRQGVPPYASYSFKHALIRDAAYEMLLKSARRGYHRQIGDALLERFPDVANARPELAAHHFTEAGAADAAVPQWMKAGSKAAAESANLEAISHLQRALALLDTFPPSPQRDGLELAIHLTIGPPLTLAKGYVVEEVGRTYLRAQELNERGGDLRQRFWIGLGICQFRLVRGEIGEAQRLALRNLELAESLGDPSFVARAHCVLGATSTYAGEFAAAAEWLDRALAGIPAVDLDYLNFTGLDLAALAHAFAAWANWHLGFSDRAREHASAALASAKDTGRAHAFVWALVFAGAEVSHFLGDVAGVQRFSTEVAELSARHGFPLMDLMASLWLRWADSMTQKPRPSGGGDETSQSLLRAFQATGSVLALGYFMAVAAETQWRCGSPERAEAIIDEALALDLEQSDPMWQSEVNRMKGELLLARLRAGDLQDPEDMAVGYVARAVQIARRQGSRALEERAAATLARIAVAPSGSALAQS